jgi:hypothetical protein
MNERMRNNVLLAQAPITVIDTDGLTPVGDWDPTGDDRVFLAEAGINTSQWEIIDHEGGLYGVECDKQVLGKIFLAWQTDDQYPGAWSWTEAPAWEDEQRGEGGCWLHLPSGTWVGLAPIDLEDMFPNG